MSMTFERKSAAKSLVLEAFFQCKECLGYQSSSTVNTFCQRSKIEVFFSASAARGQPQFVVLNNTGRSRSGNLPYALCKGQGCF